MSWKDQLRKDSVPWLLETENPGIRYLALRDLMDSPGEQADLKSARRKAHKDGPIAKILSHMEPAGYWIRPGPGYNPKYRSIVWSLILLAQLGASAREDTRIEKACKYILDHNLTEGGQFTTMTSGAPSGTVDCLQGNICWALMELGYDHPRLKKAYQWMARAVTGDGIAPRTSMDSIRYYAYKSGPLFACGVNGDLPCAWGGAKVMLAFGKWPARRRTPLIRKAIKRGVDFFLGIDPVSAGYPTRDSSKPNRSWWKFGFPVFYVTDILQIAEVLVGLSLGRDRRLSHTLDLIRSKQDQNGRWALKYEYKGKTWVDFGKLKQPNKWVTLRALRVLKAAG
jgi:hypothetical protein